MKVHAHACKRCLGRSEGGVRYSEVGVSCLMWVLGNKLESFTRAASVLNC